MKTKTSLVLLVLVLGFAPVFSGCEDLLGLVEDDDSDDESAFDGKSRFIALHLDEPSLSQLSIHDGEPVFSPLSDMYPYRYDGGGSQWKQSFHQANQVLGFTLHQDLSEEVEDNTRWTGVWMDLEDGEAHDLPRLNPCLDFGYDSGCNRFSFTRRNSVRVGTCGNIFYVAASQYSTLGWSGGERRYRLVRLDPRTENYEKSPLITPFTLEQPEIDPDRYGLGTISDQIFPSTCGRYVYGRTAGWGISGGSLIASRGVLFRYDFEEEEFSRVEEVDYDFDPRYVTADNRYLLYYDGGARQSMRYDMQTGQVSEIENAHVAGSIHQTGINDRGTAGGAYPLREIWYNDVVADEIIKIPVPHNLPRGVQFSADGSYLYFRYDHEEENLLLRTSDLTDQATVEELAVLPEDVRIMAVLP